MLDNLEWPVRPAFSPLSYGARETIFGHIAVTHQPTPGDPEAVVITNDFMKHIVRVHVPQLMLIPGIISKGKVVGHGPRDGMVLLHELAANPMIDLWQAWDDAGLLDRILTDGGMFCPRLVRGSTSVLSNHAYGTAFDINAPWNGLKREPAHLGMKGCVRELVDIANSFGWWWGGHGWPSAAGYFDGSRLDGMHFELARLQG